jgi:hypothetical protein
LPGNFSSSSPSTVMFIRCKEKNCYRWFVMLRQSFLIPIQEMIGMRMWIVNAPWFERGKYDAYNATCLLDIFGIWIGFSWASYDLSSINSYVVALDLTCYGSKEASVLLSEVWTQIFFSIGKALFCFVFFMLDIFFVFGLIWSQEYFYRWSLQQLFSCKVRFGRKLSFFSNSLFKGKHYKKQFRPLIFISLFSCRSHCSQNLEI